MIPFGPIWGNSKILPYDAEIKYLTASGTQYIKTDFIPKASTRIELSGFSTQVATGYWTFFGMRYNSERFACRTHTWESGVGGFFQRSPGSGLAYNEINEGLTKAQLLNSPKTIVFNDAGKCYAGGTLKGTFPAIQNDDRFHVPIYIFACNNNGSAVDKAQALGICWLKIYEEVVLIHDFIPVRIGNIGYLYDKVSGQLFGNQGTGNFILGPDINA